MTIDRTCVEREGWEWPGQCGRGRPNAEALPVAAPTAEAQEEHKVNRLRSQCTSPLEYRSLQKTIIFWNLYKEAISKKKTTINLFFNFFLMSVKEGGRETFREKKIHSGLNIQREFLLSLSLNYSNTIRKAELQYKSVKSVNGSGSRYKLGGHCLCSSETFPPVSSFYKLNLLYFYDAVMQSNLVLYFSDILMLFNELN